MFNSTSNPTRTLHIQKDPNNTADPQVPLRNLSLLRTQIDSLQRLLSQSINTNAPLTALQTATVSNNIASAIHQTIVNGAALVSFSQNSTTARVAIVSPEPPAAEKPNSKLEPPEDDDYDDFNDDEDCEIVELDAVELLAEHIHFCEICGKGFRRDANLRMHMRAHGNQFKTAEALAKPSEEGSGATRRRAMWFSCPFEGCNRNKMHGKFRAMKSVVCVKNHFKRSHCPKMYSCNRCHKKSFAVLSDLKSHMKHCGESPWKCSCGTTFSRKDKLFGHIALFEGHMPSLDEDKGKQVQVVVHDPHPFSTAPTHPFGNSFDAQDLPPGFFDDFGSIDDYCLREVLGFPTNLT